MAEERTPAVKLALAIAKANYEIKKFALALEYMARVITINQRR